MEETLSERHFSYPFYRYITVTLHLTWGGGCQYISSVSCVQLNPFHWCFSFQLKETHDVNQYHYIAWPDHGTPEPMNLLDFHYHVMSSTNKSQAPTVVHCRYRHLRSTITDICYIVSYVTHIQMIHRQCLYQIRIRVD